MKDRGRRFWRASMARASGRSWRRGSRPVGAQRGAARIVRSVFRVPALVTPREGAPRATRRWRLAEGWAKRRVGEEARSSRDFWRGADRSARGEGDTRGDARDRVESHLLISKQRAGRFWTSARARAPPRSGSRGPQPRASGPATGPRSAPHPGASMFASASADEPSARLGSRRRDARRATRRRCHPPRRVTPSIPCERPRSLAWVWQPRRPVGGLASSGGKRSPLVDVARWYRRENVESLDYRVLIITAGTYVSPSRGAIQPNPVNRARARTRRTRPRPRSRSPAADLRPPAARQPTTRDTRDTTKNANKHHTYALAV